MYKNLPIPIVRAGFSLMLFLLITFSSFSLFAQKNYHVGPGQAMTKLSQVPWKILGPGDVVSIHYSPNPYREKIVISSSGAPGRPITIIGVTGPNGEKPIIDGENAESHPEMMCNPEWDVYGLIYIVVGTDANNVCKVGKSYGPIPHDIVIENLEIRNAHPNKSFIAPSGKVSKYDIFSAGIYAERVQDLVIRSCNFNKCAIGLFINSKFLTKALSKNILIEKNIFTDNGVINDYHDHGLYVEAENVIYQYNFFDKLTDGALGASVKDRSSGNIFRYNWINASRAHAVQIAEPQGGVGILDLLPSYKETQMYGNVIFSGVNGAVRNIRYGGDQSNYKYYRQGTLYFYNNTVIIERNKTLGPNNQYDISLFFMPDGGEVVDTVTLKTKVDCRNNVIYLQPTAGSPIGTEVPQLSILSTNLSGEVNMVNNWLSPGIQDIYQFNAAPPKSGKLPNSGRVTHINTIYGNNGKNDPGFTDYAKGDYSLLATSNAINIGTALPTAATPYPVLEEYIKHFSSRAKVLVGAPDAGAYESPTDQQAPVYPSNLVTTYGASDFNPGDPTNANTPIPISSSNSAVASIVSGKIHILGAGNTTITATAMGKQYALNLTVNKKTLTVRPNAAFRAVGAPNPPFSLIYTGFVNGENESALTKKPIISCAADVNSPVTVSPTIMKLPAPSLGTYLVYNPTPIVASGGAAANYNLVYEDGVLTIYLGKATQAILMQPENAMLYGQPDFDIGATSNNPTIPITFTSSDPKVATIVNGKIHITGVGKTIITASQAGNAQFLAAKDYISNLTIDPAVLLVTPEDKFKLINTPNPLLTMLYSGFVYGEDEKVLTKVPTLTTKATLTSLEGKYDINANGATALNYTFKYATGNLTVGTNAQTVQTITFPAITPLTYGAADFTLNASSSNPSIPLQYTSSNTNVAVINGGIVHITGAGSANITVSQAGDANFQSASKVQALVINKAPLTITADKKTKQEGSINPALTASFSGFVNSENQTALTAQATLTTTATTASIPGDYPITASGAAANNYQISYLPGNLKVIASPVGLMTQTLTFPATAIATYGDIDFAAGATSSNGTISINYQSSNPMVATILNGKIHIVGAGTTTITASQPGNSQYSAATDIMQTLTIKKAPLVITADIQVKIAGVPNPVFTLSYFGFVYGEDEKALSSKPIITTSATTVSPAGIYPLNVSGATAANYDIKYVNSTLTVSNANRIPITSNDVTNILSPNADGINDYWIIKNIELYPTNHVRVLDTSGRIVFEKRNYDNSWDGKYKGKVLTTDAYIFLIEPGEGHKKLKGTLTIIP